jgi:predicted amidohydrolase
MDIAGKKCLITPESPPAVRRTEKAYIRAHGQEGILPLLAGGQAGRESKPRVFHPTGEPDPVEVLNAVHSAGGIALLAHPFLIDDKAAGGRERYIARLIEAGLDGIEATYPYRKTSFGGSESDEEIERYIRATYASLRILSGGSDYHADAKKGVRTRANMANAA